MRMWIFKNLCFVSILMTPLFIKADIKLSGLMSDGMVLQRDIEIPVWGWAAPDEKIDITLGKQTIQTKADKDGNWIVRFNPLKASAEPIELAIKANNTIKHGNILIGDVWLCSGQSNMAMSVGSSMNSKAEIENADNPQIRIFNVPLVSSFSPRKDIDGYLTGGWQICSPRTIPGFSAVGYFYGRELFKELNIPIGLILSAWAGTPAIAWTSPNSMGKYKDTLDGYDRYRQKQEKELGFNPGDSDKMQDWTKTKLKWLSLSNGSSKGKLPCLNF